MAKFPTKQQELGQFFTPKHIVNFILDNVSLKRKNTIADISCGDGKFLSYAFNKIKKLHILMHPFSWSEYGYSNYSNFVSLIRDRNEELLDSMNSETSTFPQELLN